MKLFIKLMLFVVVLAMAGPFLMKGPDGRPLLTLEKLGLPSVPQLKQMITTARNNLPIAKTESTATNSVENDALPRNDLPTAVRPGRGDVFYKWQNEHGIWQFTTEPPSSPTTYQEVYTDPQANIIQSIPKDTIQSTLGFSDNASTDPKKSNEKNKPAEDIESGLSLTTVPITQIPKLMEDAKAARKIMDDHQKNLDQAIGDAEGERKKSRF
jgi:hypothetical protein